VNEITPDGIEIGVIYEWRPLCIIPQAEKNALTSHLKDAGWDLGRIAAAVKSYHLATIPGLIMLGVPSAEA
jgi:hypothetical protein